MKPINKNHTRLKDFIQEYMLILFLIFMAIIITIFVPRFLSAQNLINVMTQIAINALLATGMTFVILTAGIDLSVGSIAALAGIVATALIKQIPQASVLTCVALSILVSIIVGGICGGFSGFAIAKLNVAPFIATLAMMSIARGIAFVYTKSRPIFELPETFNWIGWGYIGVIPVIVLVMIIILVFSHIVIDKTRFGKYIYAVGGNEEGARFSGINVEKIKFMVYVINGILSAFAGVCLASRLATGQPAAARGYELIAITAVVMGGTSLFGGRGGIPKTVIGILTIGIINNGLSLMQVSSYWQSITMGFMILIAVAFDQIRVKKE